MLIANHTAHGALFTIDPATGASEQIDVDGLVPGTPDGLLLAGRDVWVVENFANTLVRVTLSPDRSSGTITSTISSSLFHVPTTVAKHGDRLAVVNARFDLGFAATVRASSTAGYDLRRRARTRALGPGTRRGRHRRADPRAAWTPENRSDATNAP